MHKSGHTTLWAFGNAATAAAISSAPGASPLFSISSTASPGHARQARSHNLQLGSSSQQEAGGAGAAKLSGPDSRILQSDHINVRVSECVHVTACECGRRQHRDSRACQLQVPIVHTALR